LGCGVVAVGDGIRTALGVAPAGVIRLVLSRVTLLVEVGVVIGVRTRISM
jgi:hypothetical protein